MVFDAPGKATAWGTIGCVLCIALDFTGVKGQLIITVITALIGCYK